MVNNECKRCALSGKEEGIFTPDDVPKKAVTMFVYFGHSDRGDVRCILATGYFKKHCDLFICR